MIISSLSYLLPSSPSLSLHSIQSINSMFFDGLYFDINSRFDHAVFLEFNLHRNRAKNRLLLFFVIRCHSPWLAERLKVNNKPIIASASLVAAYAMVQRR